MPLQPAADPCLHGRVWLEIQGSCAAGIFAGPEADELHDLELRQQRVHHLRIAFRLRDPEESTDPVLSGTNGSVESIQRSDQPLAARQLSESAYPCQL